MAINRLWGGFRVALMWLWVALRVLNCTSGFRELDAASGAIYLPDLVMLIGCISVYQNPPFTPPSLLYA